MARINAENYALHVKRFIDSLALPQQDPSDAVCWSISLTLSFALMSALKKVIPILACRPG
jgi:hypothetical protein